MRKILAIAQKEFSSAFHSWLGVLMAALFFVASGAFFVILVLNYVKISMNPQQYVFWVFRLTRCRVVPRWIRTGTPFTKMVRIFPVRRIPR